MAAGGLLGFLGKEVSSGFPAFLNSFPRNSQKAVYLACPETLLSSLFSALLSFSVQFDAVF